MPEGEAARSLRAENGRIGDASEILFFFVFSYAKYENFFCFRSFLPIFAVG